jgi:hypothetical protein
MGRLRGFIVLVLIAIPLGWYTYRDARKGPVDDTPKRDKVFSVDADKIEELEIKAESGERTTLQRKGTDWTIVQPAGVPTDQAAVSGITSNLASAEIQRVIEENPTDLAEFGLASPRVEVAFKAGGQQHRLQIGQKTRDPISTRGSPTRSGSSSFRRSSSPRSTARRSTCATRPS